MNRHMMKALERVLEWEKKVRRNNKKFKKASKAEQRVMLAKDVIKALDKNRFTVVSGVFLPPDLNILKPYDKATSHVVAFGDACTVCAKGALFVAKVDRLNGFSLEDLAGLQGDDPSEYLLEFFSKKQLNLIELAFEGNTFDDDLFTAEGDWTRKAKRANAFYREQLPPGERMKLIMQNVIENKGTFKS